MSHTNNGCQFIYPKLHPHPQFSQGRTYRESLTEGERDSRNRLLSQSSHSRCPKRRTWTIELIDRAPIEHPSLLHILSVGAELSETWVAVVVILTTTRTITFTLRTIILTLRIILFTLRTILFITRIIMITMGTIMITMGTIMITMATIMITMGTIMATTGTIMVTMDIIKPPVLQQEEFLFRKHHISPRDQVTDFLFFLLEGGA
ncbi:uncharacterized protein LOC116411535 [Xenopus tropicalis]|uniref:Uncharacterized protein LOC116411535 n=1 Tax=Xenopus tropicalis TaxID=8364 RepID=A0A8J1JPL7_XENTR|nr:uncharacterized protein LOC116411535 [Xenopus tropicalis]